MRNLHRSAIAVLTLVACTEPSALRLAMTADRTALIAQDSVKLSLELVNQSTRTVKTFTPNSYGLCMHAFQVTDEQENQVGVTTAFCALALVGGAETDLLPGHSVSITDYWHPGSSTLNGQALVPGKYRVAGRVFVDDKTVSSGATIITLLP